MTSNGIVRAVAHGIGLLFLIAYSPGCGAAPGDAESAGEAVASGGGSSSASWSLKGWDLQLPNGDAVDNPGTDDGAYRSYLYVDAEGALTFMDPRTGVTTSGSLHPRTELREATGGWSATGKNTMTGTVAVPTIPSRTTIAQIFQAPNAPSKPLLELQYGAGGKVYVLVEKTNEGGNAGAPQQIAEVTSGGKFTYALSLSADEIGISINGAQAFSEKLTSTFVGEKFYFKWGNYDQTATKGKVSTTPGTIVKYYAHEVTHE
jgi:hypothetical protein